MKTSQLIKCSSLLGKDYQSRATLYFGGNANVILPKVIPYLEEEMAFKGLYCHTVDTLLVFSSLPSQKGVFLNNTRMKKDKDLSDILSHTLFCNVHLTGAAFIPSSNGKKLLLSGSLGIPISSLLSPSTHDEHYSYKK